VTADGLTAVALAASLLEKGVRVTDMGTKRLRAVTHLDVDAPMIERAIETIATVLKSRR
jgi:threonine aldolase